MAGKQNPSYMPNYFSIDDILATQERVPCSNPLELKDLGFLDPGSDDKHLAQGSKLEIPYWIVDGMRAGKLKYLNMYLPRSYKEIYREILLADANVVDLHKLGPYFYEFGLYLIKHSVEEGDLIGETISSTFRTRFLNILNAAQNCRDEEKLKETDKMDELERKLFKMGYKKRNDIVGWMNRDVYQIKTASAVSSFKKRKVANIS
ncbi:DNA replication complex GINS protein PSF3 [Eurytemora carolleeae]|uniref:DNA replication complex GINS protein PSF3 n=1 Tax=Eurytemora carolleeae TaxID=1294199 RepID=UPI000C79515A|nr:DNA replication complex GINS protein PSF3 [Eurytemora carolleeae]|eukprot:XP_023349041.1 DNA replication complex GINS protein PSF3-like [Eurytemora affinis]